MIRNWQEREREREREREIWTNVNLEFLIGDRGGELSPPPPLESLSHYYKLYNTYNVVSKYIITHVSSIIRSVPYTKNLLKIISVTVLSTSAALHSNLVSCPDHTQLMQGEMVRCQKSKSLGWQKY